MSETKTFIKNLGLSGFGMGAQTAEIDVKDDKIVRIRPLHFNKSYSVEEMRPWKIEARGKVFEAADRTGLPPLALVYKKRAYSANRILYPMRRVDWDPQGERHPENRGKSKFIRISWDEATDIIAAELNRVKKAYGPYAILAQGDGHGETKIVHASHSCQMRLLRHFGGFCFQARNPDSWEGWYWGAKHVWGQDPVGQADMGNLFLDIAENTDMLLFWGCDVEATPWGWGGQISSRYCSWLTEIGVKQVYICPDVNYGNAVHADKWIPVFPNTDAALQCAIAYTWLTEGTWDKEYMATHAYGHEHVIKYILGDEDGVPKTPKWAEPICGVPARTIKALARKWARETTSIAHCNGGSYIRSTYSTEPARLEVFLLALQALGKPGRNVIKFMEWGLYGLSSQSAPPLLEFYPNPGAAYGGFDWNNPQVFDIRESFLPKTLIHTALLGDYTVEEPLKWHGVGLAGWPKEEQFNEYQYPSAKAGSPIHMIWCDNPCWTTCWNGGNSFIEALRKPQIECVVIQHPWMENDCLLADILLPINTKFEENDIGVDLQCGDYGLIYPEDRCIASRGESMSDWEAVGEVAKKLGLYELFVEGKDEQEWIRLGFESSGTQDRISYEEWRRKGYYLIPPKVDWQKEPRGFGPFYEDPDAHPLATPTGKLEFYSEFLAAVFPNDDERPPSPRFIPYGETHQESRLHPRSEQYPFLLVSNHPRWRVHANMNDVAWLREIPTCKVTGQDGYQYEPLWVHPSDAQRLGIKSGDVVRIGNDRGWVLGGAIVTERIKPGVVLQDHGASCDPIVSGESDRAGANNLIAPTATTSRNVPGEVTSGYLVAVEKVDLDALAAEYPEAFSRSFVPGIGVCIDSWMEDLRI